MDTVILFGKEVQQMNLVDIYIIIQDLFMIATIIFCGFVSALIVTAIREKITQIKFAKVMIDIAKSAFPQKLNIMLDTDAKKPEKAHTADAGFDLFARETQIIPARESATFDTGVHIEIPQGYVGFLKSKSGLNVKHDILSEGVIDSGYSGSIVAKLYNNGGYDYTVKKGDKITQLVILPIADVQELKEVTEFKSTERGSNGFGSSGK